MSLMTVIAVARRLVLCAKSLLAACRLIHQKEVRRTAPCFCSELAMHIKNQIQSQLTITSLPRWTMSLMTVIAVARRLVLCAKSLLAACRLCFWYPVQSNMYGQKKEERKKKKPSADDQSGHASKIQICSCFSYWSIHKQSTSRHPQLTGLEQIKIRDFQRGEGHVISGADGYALDVLFRCSAWYVPRLVLLDGKYILLCTGYEFDIVLTGTML
jgi:hypothetical protein